ncbi:MAG TPA: T9SS type A sorting domain-containing protein [Chitinophagaceae bacterium]|jgi:hypothetical protein|nr:T9SS type A sorting domain-containing protein [Chitinophagaceae bacterium]
MKKILPLIALSIVASQLLAQNQNVGDYRSRNDGNWNNINTWQYWDGSTWKNVTNTQGYPGQKSSGKSVTITNGNDITLNTSPTYSIADLTIGNGSGSNESLVFSSGNDLTLTISGNLTLSDGDLSVNNQNGTNIHTLNIGGDLSVDNTSNINTSSSNDVISIILNGTADQSIGGGATSISIERLTIDKSSGSVTLNTNLAINGNLTFTNGILNTSSTNLLTINNNATVSGASDASFVQGPVKKVGNDAFTFPVGNAANGYHPLSMSAPSSSSSAFTAEYVRSNGQSNLTQKFQLAAVSGCEYWNFNRNNGSSNPNVTLTWNEKSPCGGDYITTLNGLTIAYYDHGNSYWKNSTGSSLNYISLPPYSSGSITRNALTSFGELTFASLDLGNVVSPLPVKFGTVTATALGSSVKVDWQTYNEVNVDHYEVERSADGVHFSTVGSVVANNVTQLSNYSLTDASPLGGNSFYRVKNVDIDGKFSYSVIVKVSTGSQAARMALYPNPATSGSSIALQLTGLQKGTYKLRVFNSTGQEVFTQQVVHTGGSVTQSLQLPSSLRTGIYNVQLSGTDVKWNKALVIE